MVSNSSISFKIFTFRPCDIIVHVAVRPSIYGVLLVAIYNHMLILHSCGELKTEEFCGLDLDLLGSRDVTDHVTIGLEYVVSFRSSIITV